MRFLYKYGRFILATMLFNTGIYMFMYSDEPFTEGFQNFSHIVMFDCLSAVVPFVKTLYLIDATLFLVSGLLMGATWRGAGIIGIIAFIPYMIAVDNPLIYVHKDKKKEAMMYFLKDLSWIGACLLVYNGSRPFRELARKLTIEKNKIEEKISHIGATKTPSAEKSAGERSGKRSKRRE